MTQSDYAKRLTALTAREIQVLREVSMGKTQIDTGKELGISVRTVEEHLRQTKTKLRCNFVQAVVIAAKAGLV